MMKLGAPILKILAKKYTPSATIDMVFHRYDLTLGTDPEGNPVQLFLGKRNEEGRVIGDRFARTLKYDRDGKLIKDHWERKGPAT